MIDSKKSGKRYKEQDKHTNLIAMNQILDLATEIAIMLDDNKINYMFDGSLAYFFLTGEEFRVNDIDTIISEKDFELVIQQLKATNTRFNPVLTNHSIHANHLDYLGQDKKPFDVSFDSYEHYFEKHGIKLKNSVVLRHKGIPLNFMGIDDLLKMYLIGIEGAVPDKRKLYEKKVIMLKKLSRVG